MQPMYVSDMRKMLAKIYQNTYTISFDEHVFNYKYNYNFKKRYLNTNRKYDEKHSDTHKYFYQIHLAHLV